MAKDIIKKINLFLRLLPIRKYIIIDGWLTKNEALGLYEIARQLPKEALAVEIGSWQGKSTYCIAKGLRRGKVYAIDPFNADTGPSDGQNVKTYEERMGGKNLLNIFQSNMTKLCVSNKVVIKKGYSGDFHDDFEKIDFLFIDGDHSIKGCKNDYNLYAHKIVKGGFIAFHDYYEEREDLGPTHVIKNMPNGEFRFYAQHDSLWVGKKT
jgi:MMP 1-O-methyltransferase